MTKDVEVGGDFSANDYSDPSRAPLSEADELTKWSFYRALVAEFAATLLFLYITVATVICYENQTDLIKNPAPDAACWAFGGMIFILVYSELPASPLN